MEKKSAEDYLDKLFNSVNDETEAAEYDQMVANEKEDKNSMYSRRVSKSEEDFLREFEAELAGDGETAEDLFAEFEKTIESEAGLSSEESLSSKESLSLKESYLLDDVDLAEIVNESANIMSMVPEETPSGEMPVMSEESSGEMAFSLNDFAMASEPIPMDEIPEDMFDELFGEPGELNLAEISQEMPTEEEGLDLGNLGDEDLMNLLAGADGLEDIGNMLNKGEVTEISPDELDAFSAFAESEMSAQQISADPASEEEPKKKGKKGSLFKRIKDFLLKSDEDELELQKSAAPMVEVLTEENADILAELDALEEMPSKKDKKKKEKKKKEKKEKKPKAAKPKKPKAPKPKKEKKPKEVDNTPPLPRGPVFMIWAMVLSLMALVLLGIDLVSYNSSLASAKSLQNQGHYAEAFTELNGLKIKEKDMEMYGQLAILATVDSELDTYEVFAKAEIEDKAFDSLICAAGRCYVNEEDADVYGCLGQLEILKKSISNELQEKYSMTYEEAIEMYTIRRRNNYTIALYKKLTELGIKWD